jgi:hypothetical protein
MAYSSGANAKSGWICNLGEIDPRYEGRTQGSPLHKQFFVGANSMFALARTPNGTQISHRRITEASHTIPNRTARINRATAVPRASALGSGGGGGIFMLLLVRCGKPACTSERTSHRPSYDLFNVTRTQAPDCVSTSSIRPPCASTSDLEIAKPKPLPPR